MKKNHGSATQASNGAGAGVTSVLFVCHGNICRSPMAERVFNRLAHEAGLDGRVLADSAATSAEEIGNPIYPPARRTLASHGIADAGHRARRFTPDDYGKFDRIYVMDRMNLENARRIAGGDPAGKIRLLLGDEEIDDPWYTDDFEKAFRQIERGCRSLVNELNGN